MIEQISEPKTNVVVDLTFVDGNAFVLLGVVSRELKRGGKEEFVKDFMTEATSGDYDNLLRTIGKYVKVTWQPEEDTEYSEY